MTQRPFVVQTAQEVPDDIVLRHYEAVVRTSPDAILVVDAKGCILLANPAVAHILGHDPAPLLGHSLQAVLHGDDAAAVERLLQQALEKPGQRLQTTFRIPHKDGSLLILEASFARVPLPPGQAPQVVLTARDITPRIHAQQALKEREQLLNRAERIAQLASWEVNRTTGEVTAGEALFHIFGLAPQPHVPVDVLRQFYHPEDRDFINAALQTAQETFKPFDFCHRIIRADGKERILHVRGEVELYGQDLVMFGTVQDITEARKLEQKLNQSERRFRGIFNSTFQFIGMLDPQGTLLEVNQAALDFGGLKEADVLDKPFWECYWWTISPATQTWLRQAIATAASGTFVRRDVHVIGANGQHVPIDFNLKPILDGDGTVVSLIAEGRDITNQVQAQKALQESEKRYRTLIETMAEGVILVDAHGSIQTINPRASEILRAVKDDLLQRSVLADWKAIRPDGSPFSPDEYPVAETLRTGQSAEKVVMGVPKPGGGHTWISVNTEPIFADDGTTLTAAVVTLHDKTNMVQHAAALRKSRHQLRQLAKRLHEAQEEERTRMAREVHDVLGQAMSVLRMDITWLRDHAPDDDAYNERMRQALEHVNETIEMVRHISHELRPGVLDHFGLAAALDWQAEQFEQRSGLPCSFSEDVDDEDLDPDLATALFRIYQEALTNVVRHAEASSVHVALSTEGDDLVLTIQDDGKGIAEEDMQPSDSLGLLNMRERVMPWDGTVAINGTSGRGTTVSVRVPLLKAKSQPT